MNKSGVLLSICVPNFNQGLALNSSVQVLESISSIPRLEVLISDNGSTDYESELALRFAEKNLLGVKIFTGPAIAKQNQDWFSGFGANLDRLTRNSTGSYVWFLGSGDLPLPKYLQQLMRILDQQKFDNVVLGSLHYLETDRDSSILTALNTPPGPAEMIRLESVGLYPFFDHSISCNITRREVFESVVHPLGYQDSWPHVEKYLNYISVNQNFSSCVLSPELLLVDQPLDGWFTKSSAMDVFLSLGALYNDNVSGNSLMHEKFSSELFRNRILKVVSLVLQIRILTHQPIEVNQKLLRKVSVSMPLVQRMYFYASLQCTRKLLRLFRKVNSVLLWKLSK